jgi:heat shock protein HslJ
MISITRTLALMLATFTVAACSSGQQEKGTAPLENTHWRLVALGDRQVASVAGRRPAEMTLTSGEKRAQGFSSCNGFSGPYTLEGNKLRFGSIISTKMACLDGMDVETGFFSALSATTTYAIAGMGLDLFDAKGTAVARFEAMADTTAP